MGDDTWSEDMKSQCVSLGCDRISHCHGMCHTCYFRQRHISKLLNNPEGYRRTTARLQRYALRRKLARSLARFSKEKDKEDFRRYIDKWERILGVRI